LLGHLVEMLGGGGLSARVELGSVPVLAEAWELASRDVVPGGTRRNLASLSGIVEWSPGVSEAQQLVLADAQTSGGLLIAVDPLSGPALLEDLRRAEVAAATRVGTFTPGSGAIEVA